MSLITEEALGNTASGSPRSYGSLSSGRSSSPKSPPASPRKHFDNSIAQVLQDTGLAKHEEAFKARGCTTFGQLRKRTDSELEAIGLSFPERRSLQAKVAQVNALEAGDTVTGGATVTPLDFDLQQRSALQRRPSRPSIDNNPHLPRCFYTPEDAATSFCFTCQRPLCGPCSTSRFVGYLRSPHDGFRYYCARERRKCRPGECYGDCCEDGCCAVS